MPPKLGSSRHSVPPHIVLTAVIVAAMLIIVPIMFLQVRSVERSDNFTVPMEDGVTDIKLRVPASGRWRSASPSLTVRRSRSRPL